MSNEERLKDQVLNLLEQLNHANVRIEGFERSERTHRAEVERLQKVIDSRDKIIQKLVDKLG
jgi:hypothetical protein